MKNTYGFNKKQLESWRFQRFSETTKLIEAWEKAGTMAWKSLYTDYIWLTAKRLSI